MNDIVQQIKSSEQPILVSFPICPFVQRSAILLNIKQQPYQRINIDLADKPQWYLNMVPTGKVPALVINQPQQEVIFESAIINEYLDEVFGKALLPTDPLKKATERSWINFSENLIMLQFQLFSANDLQQFDLLSKQFISELLKIPVNPQARFYSGDQLSLMDAAIAPVFTRLKWLPSITEKLSLLAQSDQTTGTLLKWITNLTDHEAVIRSVNADFDEQFESFFKVSNSYAINSAAA